MQSDMFIYYVDLYLMRYTLQYVALCSRCSLMSECPSLLRQQCYSVNLRKSLQQLFWWCVFVTFELSPLTDLWLSFNIEIVNSSRHKTDISTLSLELSGKWVLTILLDIWEVNSLALLPSGSFLLLSIFNVTGSWTADMLCRFIMQALSSFSHLCCVL